MPQPSGTKEWDKDNAASFITQQLGFQFPLLIGEKKKPNQTIKKSSAPSRFEELRDSRQCANVGYSPSKPEVCFQLKK